MPFRCRLYCSILLCLLVLLPTAPAPAVSAQDPEPQPGELLRIDFTTRDELQRIAGQLDVWEVHLDEGYLLAYVLPAEREWLESLGFQLEQRAVLQPQTIPDYACYHLISEQYATLAGWAAAYPKIARVITIGYSYEGRPLQVLHIGNRSIPGPRPPLVVIANTHGRELITNEVALAFASSLLTTYGTDADSTWMVDYHDIYVMPSLNPDGHVRNEKGTPWAQWRKNTHLYPGQSIASCPPGVDLNRNSTVDWYFDNLGSSGSLCSFNYRGPSVRSEPETKAIETFMAGVFADQKAPGRTVAAPETATGVFITLHSYGNLLMWPWGAVSTASGNEAQYGYLGRKLASFNGYTAARSSLIMGYPTNGTTDDTAYGIYGVASFTYEIGSGTDGFYPACSRAPALINPNVASLRFAARVARRPYITPYGPDLSNRIVPARVQRGLPLTVTLSASDVKSGGALIHSAQAYVDTPPWAGGTPIALQATDGRYDETVETIRGSLSTTSLAPGRHILYLRARDSAVHTDPALTHWGPIYAHFFIVTGNRGLYVPAVLAE